MKLYATYCSADKEATAGDLPAIERYLSARIRATQAAADGAGARFGILSGLYGLIAPDHPLPYYDHLLQLSEMSDRVVEVEAVLRAWEIHEIHWYSVAFEMDPNVGRYRTVMEQAAAKADATVELVLWEPGGSVKI
jgi:hypothetical protein